MLKGDKVLLRPIEETDIPLLYDWLNRQESLGEFGGVDLMSKEELYNEFKKGNLWSKHNKFLIMVMDDKPIGELVIRKLYPTIKVIEIGFCIDEQAYRGQGIGYEAITLTLDYLYGNFSNMNRVQAITGVNNKISISVLEKCGFRREGLLKEVNFHHGQYQDEYLYAITRKEWMSSEQNTPQ